MRASAYVIAFAVVLTLALPATAEPTSPSAIYKALLASPIPEAQLPPGVHVTSIMRESLDTTMRKHHAVGSVGINLGELEYLQYTVFPTDQDAVSQFNAEISADEMKAASYAAAPASLHVRAQILNFLFGLGRRTNGLSGVLFVYGNVVGKADALSNPTTSKKSPFGVLAPKAVQVAISGFKHLTSVLSHR